MVCQLAERAHGHCRTPRIRTRPGCSQIWGSLQLSLRLAGSQESVDRCAKTSGRVVPQASRAFLVMSIDVRFFGLVSV